MSLRYIIQSSKKLFKLWGEKREGGSLIHLQFKISNALALLTRKQIESREIEMSRTLLTQ